MTDSDGQGGRIRTGRPLDDAGEPTDGPALDVDPDGPAAAAFAESPHALASSPGLGMWTSVLQYPDADGANDPEMLVWLAPDATELPEHVHTNRSERFRVLSGELTVVVDGAPVRVAAGDAVTVEPGEAHSFRNDTDETVAFRATVPWTRTIDMQYTTFGLDHDGKTGEDGQPGALRGLLLAAYLRDGTRITAAPMTVQRVLWATVGRVATAAGYEAVEERYLRDAYWEATVEQPDL
jgi:mannose-6-phosphate isomerase-like protein (cupin superfamily)